MQPLKKLPKPFKKAATTTNNGMNNAAVAATTNSSTFSMLTTVPPTSFYNMMQGSRQLVQSKLKQTYSGSIFCMLQDQNFHSTAVTQKDDKGRGNGKDKKGDPSIVNNNNENSEEDEIICETTLDLDSRGVRGRCPQCNGQLVLRKNQQTLNNNEGLIFCKDCDWVFNGNGRGSSTGSHQQSMRHAIAEKYKFRTPKQLKAYLDEYVIGQDDAKKAICQAVYDHYIRILTNEHIRQKKPGNQQMVTRHQLSMNNGTIVFSTDVTKAKAKKPTPSSLPFHIDFSKIRENELVRMDKANILFLGPSGVGKTFLIKTLADSIDVPMAHADCTSMTQAGYVGEDVESVLTKLLQEANGDVAKAEKGIVFLDEIDKIAVRHESGYFRDVGGEGVQHGLLKMVEGTVVNVKTGKKSTHNQDNTVQMDTTDILFIASGAFTQIDKIIGRRIQKLQLGFGAEPPTAMITADDKEQEEINKKRDKLMKDVKVEDVIKFGMIPELCGRFPVRVPFYSLSREQLKQVMSEPKNSMLEQAYQFFKLHDAILEFTEEALDEIAGMAIKDKTGARALTSILHDVLKDVKYDLPGSNIDRVRITAEFVRGESGYEVIEKSTKGRQHSQQTKSTYTNSGGAHRCFIHLTCSSPKNPSQFRPPLFIYSNLSLKFTNFIPYFINKIEILAAEESKATTNKNAQRMFAFLKNRFISASTIAVATLGGGGTSAATGIGGIGADHHSQKQQKLLPFSHFNHSTTTSIGQNLMDEEYFLRKFEEYEKNDSWDYVFQRINLESETQAKKLSLCCDLSNSFHEKNRYRNVLPYDQNRITLKSVSSENDAYINASPLHLPFARRNYILTQGPLPNTASDFWQMVFEQKVSICIMLSKVMEKSFIKCHSYFPCKDSPKLKFENFECELEHEEIKPNYIIRRIRLIPLESFRRNDEQQQSKHVENEQPTNSSNSPQQQSARIIHHFQFTTWPDFGVPEHTDHFLEFLGEVRSAREKLVEQEKHSSSKSSANPPPIVCHCSAGIGRTGTFVIVDSVVSMIQKKRAQQQQKPLVERKESMTLAPETTSATELINANATNNNNNNNNNESEVADKMVEEQLDSLEALVIFIRRHRMGLIQTSQQLRFCWKTIVDWIKKNNGSALKNYEQKQLSGEPVGNSSSPKKAEEASPLKESSTNVAASLTDIRWSTSPAPQLEEQPQPPHSSPLPNPTTTLIAFEATGNGDGGGNSSSPFPVSSIPLLPLQQSSPSPQPPSSSTNPFILASPNGGLSPPCCPPAHPTQSPPH